MGASVPGLLDLADELRTAAIKPFYRRLVPRRLLLWLARDMERIAGELSG